MKQKFKSPLKMAPLRLPGQSLELEINDALYDGLFAPLLIILLLFFLAGLEWLSYVNPRMPNPWLFSAVAITVAIWAIWRARATISKVEQLKLGRDGERVVGQFLERFRSDSFLFHDVPNGDANIDHVLIGTRGLFTIETKTMRKPERGDVRITCVDGCLFANGKALERNAVIQAKAQARWVGNFFGEAGFKVYVQPVVVFPGWFVEPFDMKSAGVWVLEPKALIAFIENEPERLTREEVKALMLALSAFIRAQAKV